MCFGFRNEGWRIFDMWQRDIIRFRYQEATVTLFILFYKPSVTLTVNTNLTSTYLGDLYLGDLVKPKPISFTANTELVPNLVTRGIRLVAFYVAHKE